MLEMYAERKSYNELRVRLNVAVNTEIVGALTWSGHRIDEFLVTDDEAEACGFPTPSFGEGVAFPCPAEKEEDVTGVLQVLKKLSDGPRLLDYQWLPEFGEFANWLWRVTYDEHRLLEVKEWTIIPCDEHFHLVSRTGPEDEDPEFCMSKLGFSVMSVLSLLEQEMAEQVAQENDEVVSEDDLEYTAVGEFIISLLGGYEDVDADMDTENPDGWEEV